MKFVLVGGSGFVGSAVSRALQLVGHEVVNVSRFGKGSAGAPGVPYGSLREVCEGAQAVINLAGANIGAKRWTRKRRKELLNSRIEPTRAIVKAIEQCTDKPALISLTGTNYYGHTTIPCNEAVGRGKTYLAQLSAAWEDEANKAAPFTRVVVLRMAPLLRADDGPLGRILPMIKMYLGARLGSGRQYFAWVHWEDAVNAIIWAAMNTDASGPYNVTGPEVVTMKQFLETVGKVVHRPIWGWVPQPLLYLAVGTMADTIDDSVRVYPMRLLGTSFTFRYPKLQDAVQSLI